MCSYADQITPGDRNCFYHAIIQQLQRIEINNDHNSSYLNLEPLPSHLQLRKTICEYIQQHQHEISYLQEYHMLYNNLMNII